MSTQYSRQLALLRLAAGEHKDWTYIAPRDIAALLAERDAFGNLLAHYLRDHDLIAANDAGNRKEWPHAADPPVVCGCSICAAVRPLLAEKAEATSG